MACRKLPQPSEDWSAWFVPISLLGPLWRFALRGPWVERRGQFIHDVVAAGDV